MRHSEPFAQVAAALAKAQSEYKPVPKNKTAKVKTKAGYEYEYKYADLSDCLTMALPLLSKNGIAFLQPHEINNGRLRVTTMLVHESGEWMQSDGIEISEDGDPQQFGSESTYFRRYDGCSFIAVAPDEDTDAQQAGQRTRKTPAQVYPEPYKQEPHVDVRASAEKRAAEIAPDPGPFLQSEDMLQCVIKGVTLKQTKKGAYYQTVTFNGRIDGFNYGFCYHASLFELLKAAVDKQINIRIGKKMSEDGRSVQYYSIEDVLWFDGHEYVGGKIVEAPNEG